MPRSCRALFAVFALTAALAGDDPLVIAARDVLARPAAT